MSIAADLSQTQIPLALPPMPVENLWRLNLDQFHAMVRQGILTEDDPVELWEGVLVQKMPKNRNHCLATELARQALAAVVSDGWHVESQEAVSLLNSELEPDVIVVRGAARDYVDKNPTAADLALVVEVADSSLVRDQEFKKPLYVQAGIPVYWIVNLVDRRIEVYSSPSTKVGKADYRQRDVFTGNENVPLSLEEFIAISIPVRDLLP